MKLEYLLDTNIVSLALRGEAEPAVARLARTIRDSVGVSIVTAMELEFGLARRPAVRVATAVRRFLATMHVAPLARSVAPVYGRLRADLERRGLPVGPLDTMIAAHAVDLGAVLVTNNTREFRRIPGLRCEDWSR